MLMQHTLFSPLMRKFNTIRHGDSRLVVRFCKENEARIDRLSGEEYFAIWTVFLEALYDREDWGYLLGVCDEVIHYSILNSIKFYNGEDIYNKALFYKAFSYYKMENIKESLYVLQQLLRLKPKSPRYLHLVKKCFMRSRPSHIAFLYSAALGLYFTAALVASVKFIYIEPFAPEYDSVFLTFQISLFCFSAFLIGFTYFLHHRWASRKAAAI
jgi:hypothetical protein